MGRKPNETAFIIFQVYVASWKAGCKVGEVGGGGGGGRVCLTYLTIAWPFVQLREASGQNVAHV